MFPYRLVISCIVEVFHVGSKANDITVLMLSNSHLVYQFEDVQEILGDVVVFLEEKDQTYKKRCNVSKNRKTLQLLGLAENRNLFLIYYL